MCIRGYHKKKNLFNNVKYISAVLLMAVLLFSNVTKVNASEDPNKITRRTFTNYSIASLTIGASVNEIEPGSFNNLHFLSSITVDEKNENFSSFDGCLYNKDRTMLVCFPQGLSGANIPKTCTKLAPGCLAGKSAMLRRQVKAVITENNGGVYPTDYPGYEMDEDDEYDRNSDPTIPEHLKRRTDKDSKDKNAKDSKDKDSKDKTKKNS